MNPVEDHIDQDAILGDSEVQLLQFANGTLSLAHYPSKLLHIADLVGLQTLWNGTKVGRTALAVLEDEYDRSAQGSPTIRTNALLVHCIHLPDLPALLTAKPLRQALSR